jgi:hypothetical protein
LKILLIDDIRTIEDVTIARTYDDGIEYLKKGKWDALYLDHDLGHEEDYKTGYGIMCWLEENQEYLPDVISFVTSNPIGRKKMEMVRVKLYG